MNRFFTYIIVFCALFSTFACQTKEGKVANKASETKDSWETASWIAPNSAKDTINQWAVYRREFVIDKEIPESALANLAVDSKYWLWVNGKMVVRMGGLKRGPNPNDTYYDSLDLKPYLKKGKNVIAILTQFFGKHGFSHNNSGKQGLIFDLKWNELDISSDENWKAWKHPSFGMTSGPHPNYRLAESNILFDANKGDFSFVNENFDTSSYQSAKIIGKYGDAPWNKLVKRPIPFWKDFGLKEYENRLSYPFKSVGDTLKMKLPYNAQVSPYLKIKATQQDTIHIQTDNYRGGGTPNIRAVYISKPGVQEFEITGWINGHNVHYYIPKGIEVLDLKYRETGYDTEFAGAFSCEDPFFNELWKKARRTLYITMRDTYMDCPDRERAQWWGDVVLESGESFYALDRKADALTQKGILELLNWQRKDSTIFSPVPAGNWDKELPGQMLASVGYYGVYNYFLHTGDTATIQQVYEPIKKYLSLYKLKDDGTIQVRQGGWIWGDWGSNKDIPLLMNTQYYLALKGLHLLAETLKKDEEAQKIAAKMKVFKKSFNDAFWNGEAYRSRDYKGLTDDRSQTLAVVSGLADTDKFDAIYKVLKAEKHASPYMEKYVAESLFLMGKDSFALKRLKERFGKMVNHPTITTLWEGWGIGKEGFGGGTINHAWSGGGLTLLSQYVAGISPITPGYKTFMVKPHLGELKEVSASVASVQGQIDVEIKRTENLQLSVNVPEGSRTKVVLPKEWTPTFLDNKEITADSQELWLESGNHTIIAK
ncbi:alpha-L-rhamnosidase-related protein [Galbibacter mesophilus]|uniref:alpha-L-rhamnosidase-related protein n=1 Tax=Galbibacter mesophilus TaxID=379069 RepID=UPI00191CD7CB|nr:alpha-L-rhamnosidase C-terminal domain-containing protein [Galbibacter mesophilus]MCM5663868.1 hypothetical protein [Galbibacter mesophilus]